jgi:hypothetical protein
VRVVEGLGHENFLHAKNRVFEVPEHHVAAAKHSETLRTCAPGTQRRSMGRTAPPAPPTTTRQTQSP